MYCESAKRQYVVSCVCVIFLQKFLMSSLLCVVKMCVTHWLYKTDARVLLCMCTKTSHMMIIVREDCVIEFFVPESVSSSFFMQAKYHGF